MQRRFLPVRVLAAAVLIGGVISAEPAAASTQVPPGDLMTQTWTRAGSPYVLSGDVTIPPGETLTIEAGVSVDVQPGDSSASGFDSSLIEIWVQGTLAVVGTAPASVRFRAMPNDDGSAGVWYGILSSGASSSASPPHA